MRNLNLKQLRAVQAIMKHGTIAAAANSLGLTPPAVTIQLKLIEDDANIILFDRTNGVYDRPSPAWLFSTRRR